MTARSKIGAGWFLRTIRVTFAAWIWLPVLSDVWKLELQETSQ
jgi:hypothetical protein